MLAQPLTHSSAPQHNADQLANSISNMNIHSDSQVTPPLLRMASEK